MLNSTSVDDSPIYDSKANKVCTLKKNTTFCALQKKTGRKEEVTVTSSDDEGDATFTS